MSFKKINRRLATLATMAYADVFNFPFTRKEFILWMIKDTHLPLAVRAIKETGGYYFFKGKSRLVELRRKREAYQEGKWEIGRRAAGYLSWIPSIQLIGITGGLAMNNARAEDDIDLFVITSQGTLWASRLLATLLLDALKLRRRPNDMTVADKVCLNMFMAPSYMVGISWGLEVPKREHDLFSAHEVLQMQPLFVRGEAYHKFLRANEWVSQYLPKAWDARTQGLGERPHVYKPAPVDELIIWFLRMVEFPLKAVQLWYMHDHRTREVISDSAIRFHPKDARIWIKRKLAARLIKYHIPLDKVFYAG